VYRAEKTIRFGHSAKSRQTLLPVVNCHPLENKKEKMNLDNAQIESKVIYVGKQHRRDKNEQQCHKRGVRTLFIPLQVLRLPVTHDHLSGPPVYYRQLRRRFSQTDSDSPIDVYQP